MRVESSVTSLSWIPSEAVSGANKSMFEIGFTHYDDPPPDVLGDLDEMRDADAFRFANRLEGWVEVEDGRIVDAGYGRRRGDGLDHGQSRRQGRHVRGGGAPASARRAGGHAGVGHVRADLRRAHRVARAAARAAAAVRAVPRAARVDDAEAHDQRRRFERVRAHRREHVPAPLGVRPGGQARGQGRARRLQAVVPQVVRPLHAVGLHEQHRARDRGRDRARARAGRADHARRRAAEAAQAQARRAAHRAGRARRRSVPRARRCARSRGRRAAARRVRARARSSANARCSKAGSARRPCVRSRSAASRSRVAISSTARRSSRSARVTVARRHERRREASLLRRSRLDVGARCGVRSGRRAHVVRRARARRRTVDACCSTRAPASVASPTISTAARSRARSLLTHLHWDHVQGLPFFAAGDRDDAHVRVFMPGSDRRRRAGRAMPTDVLALAMSPPHFPIGPDGLRGEWTFESVKPGSHRIEGFDVVAFDVPAQGRAHLRLPDLRRPRRRSRTSPTICPQPDTTPAIARECAGRRPAGARRAVPRARTGGRRPLRSRDRRRRDRPRSSLPAPASGAVPPLARPPRRRGGRHRQRRDRDRAPTWASRCSSPGRKTSSTSDGLTGAATIEPPGGPPP